MQDISGGLARAKESIMTGVLAVFFARQQGVAKSTGRIMAKSPKTHKRRFAINQGSANHLSLLPFGHGPRADCDQKA